LEKGSKDLAAVCCSAFFDGSVGKLSIEKEEFRGCLLFSSF
jgi:hypothetical protein